MKSTGLPQEIESFIEAEVVERFVRYARIATPSDPFSTTKPSSPCQMDLLSLLERELRSLDLHAVRLDSNGFLFATLPGQECEPFGLMAHVDTSPDQSGIDVKPVVHSAWNGSVIRFPDDPGLILDVEDCRQLGDFVGDTIITASGKTLLGADDKAGVAEIMTALAAFRRFPQLRHGEIRICFTTDEEVGRGVEGIDESLLPRYLYTMDGGYPGELEAECFDAVGVTVTLKGRGVHPGYAYGKMVNAATMAALFIAMLPASERPETTRNREGFFHVVGISGNNEESTVRLILRDFEHGNNEKRLEFLRESARRLESEHPGLQITIDHVHQYQNMRDVLAGHPELTELAARAIEDAGVTVRRKAIRGGTDGSKLTAMGYPTPNIFAGGMLFHSRKEWVARSSMVRAVATILHLGKRWAERLA